MTMRVFTAFAVFAALGAGLFAAPPVPRPAKELEVVEPNGQHHLLTSYRGKVVLVQMLYTTCPHCQAYSQLLTKLQGEYGPKGFQPLGLAFNEADNGMVSNYISMYKVGFPVGAAQRDTVLNFLEYPLAVRFVVPQIVLIDKKGQIREQSEAYPAGGTAVPLQTEAHLRASIEKLLAEGASGKAAPATGSTTKAAPQKPQS
jgi:thiol-disulfide isomerase/thioredoxin